jgi:predicted dehydrogenase
MSVTVAVIGCGNISRYHFAGLEKCGARVKWVCDISPSAAAPWAQKFNAEHTPDYRRALADPGVDAVFVTLVSRLHREICLAAIDAGKAVVCEKTLSESAADSFEIASRARERGTLFYTSYMKRFIPAVEKAKELLPRLGKIMSSHIRAYQYWGDLWTAAPDKGFFHIPPGGVSQVRKNYGGGILVCGGSHILDLVCFMLGRPERLYASFYEPEGRDYDLRASALMEGPNGVVHYEALAHPLGKIGFLRDGWDEKLEINGFGGRLEILSAAWDHFKEKSSVLVHYDNTSGKSEEYRFDCVSPFERAVEFFCAQIERGEQGAQSEWTGYETDELIEQIKISGASRQAVTVPWKN